MTESNKLRIVKYFHISCRVDLKDTPIDYETIIGWVNGSPFYQRQYNVAVESSIAEVEAIQTELEHHRVFETHDEYLAQLAELKQLL